MVCRRCGKEVDPGDRFCRSCGTPVKKEKTKASGEKQAGYKDDIESTMGHFDGKYLMMAGIILGILIILGAVRKITYNYQNKAETAVETTIETTETEMSRNAEPPGAESKAFGFRRIVCRTCFYRCSGGRIWLLSGALFEYIYVCPAGRKPGRDS